MFNSETLTSERKEGPKVRFKFETRPEENAEKTREAGHAVFEDVDYITWYSIGDNLKSTSCRASKTAKFYPHIWQVARPLYEAWKQGQDDPVTGTALAEWPAIGRGMVETLRGFNVRSVEDLADINDAAMQRIGMGARALRDKARAWLESAKTHGKMAEELKARDDRITAMDSENRQLRADLDELRAMVERLQPRQRAPIAKG